MYIGKNICLLEIYPSSPCGCDLSNYWPHFSSKSNLQPESWRWSLLYCRAYSPQSQRIHNAEKNEKCREPHQSLPVCSRILIHKRKSNWEMEQTCGQTFETNSRSNTRSSVLSTMAATNNSNTLDDAFDDACDLGQCCMDPCYFCYVKLKKWWTRYKRCDHESQKVLQEKEKDLNQIQRNQKALFMFAVQQTTYLLLIVGGWSVVFLRAYPLISESQHVSNIHKVFGCIVCGLCIFSWVLAKFTTPGTITSETIDKFNNYSYDGVLYDPHDMCVKMPTVPKIARSKYDRYTHQQIPRFDHYCGWIGNAVGEENYRFFLMFVLIHTVMVVYGTVILYELWEETNDALVLVAMILIGISVPFLLSFSAFHLLLVTRNHTTNEHFEWKALATDRNNTRKSGLSKFSSTHTKEKQFYDLGIWMNLREVMFPRSLNIVEVEVGPIIGGFNKTV